LFESVSADRIVINDREQIHHLKDVLRLKVDDQVVVFDDRENEYTCSIGELLADRVVLEIKEQRRRGPKSIRLTVACAIPKRSRMDDIIDKLTQLGVDRIIPLETEHMVVKLNSAKKIARLERWKKIAQSAAQQSQRNSVPAIDPVSDITEVFPGLSGYDLKLIPVLFGERKLLKDISLENKARNIIVFIGPEGDFSSREINLAVEAGCLPVTLGDLVLRVETAAVTVAGFLKLYLCGTE